MSRKLSTNSHDIDYDCVVQELIESGVSSILLPEPWRERHERCFRTARNAVDFASQLVKEMDTSSTVSHGLPFPTIQSGSDPASATGFHLSGIEEHRHPKCSFQTSSMSRYNTYREGFIFSNGDMFHVDLKTSKNDDLTFYESMSTLFRSMHDDIACPILEAIAKYLDLPDENWFQVHLGPTSLHSQWHVKRFVHPGCISTTVKPDNDLSDDSKQNQEEWLPSHTDPSLISIVIHDAPITTIGGLGLQYQLRTPCIAKGTTKIWNDIPRHGHGVATILVGSILHYMTGGFFPSAKHRVVYQNLNNDRIAATLFVRPRGDSILAPPPSHILSTRIKHVKFSDWLAKVSRNYAKISKQDSAKHP